MNRNKGLEYGFNSLTMEEAKTGVETCIQNSERLLQAGKALYREGFVEQATFLACTAIEEVGKATLLLNYQEQRFCKDHTAARTLAQSFTQHVDKLESALLSWEWDETLFRDIPTLPLKDRSIEEVASTLRQFYTIVKVQRPKARASRTFKWRNQMLYTDFQNNKFISPQKRADKRTFEELLDIAEKTIVRARMDAAIGLICYKRGASREQLGNLFLEHLPSIAKRYKGRTKPTI